ncbi:ROK family protein [Curtobacterium sp. MCPF17_052]|uniref:ROK family protein n=1 Tax=Curtobacterium sp. MCPF17_052 TaxID=2175655 RepID=UPI0024DFC21E|nr:ROK family protein [Curtobacterium sp. MCPF17_052]WIB13626.1 ROK family protein [Curtobacterium sp. MCPF17_052]
MTPDRLVRIAVERGVDLGGAGVGAGAGSAGAGAGAGSAGEAGAGVAVDLAAVDRAWDAIGAAIAAGDPVATTFAAEVGTVMGRAVVVIVNLLDVDRVVFGGPFWSRIATAALPAAAAAITGSPILVPKHPVTVVESRRGTDVAAVGAACLVLDAALSPRASTMLIAH